MLTTLLTLLSCTVVQAGWVKSDTPYAGGGAFHTLGVELAGDLQQ